MGANLKDIAQHLNISVSTVSRVVNNKDRVSPETRERVSKALIELQYTPNEVARSLKSKSVNTIGVIVSDISNNFYSSVIKGIEGLAWEKGFSIIVCNSDGEAEREKEYTQLLLQKQIAGLIIATVGGNMSFFKQYSRQGIPVIFIDNLPKLNESFDYVTINNINASYELTCHLIEQGHKDIAIITGSLDETTAAERLQGWKNALSENGISIRKKWIGTGNFRQESGYKIMKSFLEKEDKPTAILAANNFLAYGAVRAIYDSGLKIPEDISIVCFDAFDPTGLVRPQITSIIQPAEEIGRISVDIAIRKSQSKNKKVYEKVILEPKLEIKESSGCKAMK